MAVDKSAWEYVEVPSRTLTGGVHQGVGINREHFGPGKHLVPPETAKEMRTLLDRAALQEVRLLQDRVDLKALHDLFRSGAITPETLETSVK